MTDKLVVNFAALHQAAGDIQNAISSMESQLHEAESTAQPLVASWDGDAKEAYQQRQQKWTQAANDLGTMLRDIKKAVEESASHYQDTEHRNTNLFH
jgi:early secretory antigenic target protein ESAT-6